MTAAKKASSQAAGEHQPGKMTERPAFASVAAAVSGASVTVMLTFSLAWFSNYWSGPTYSPKLMGVFVGEDSSDRPVVLYVPEKRGERLLFVAGEEAFYCEGAEIISVNNGSSLTARLTCAATGDPHGGLLTFGEGNSLQIRFRDRLANTSQSLLRHSR